jgi:hypothetical protein
VIPTLFEGFGIPAIEALALGCELICSDLPVLREVAGEAPLYFGVNDVEGLVRRVREVMTGSRHGRDARATVDLRRFSWEAAASRLLEVFREAHRRFWEKPAGGAKVGVIRGDADEVAEFDLVVEVGEGCRLLPGALEAAAVAWQREPGKRVYLGEAYETVGGKRREVAYLRFTGDGLYRFEGGAYPAMVFRRPGDRKALEAVYSERRDSEVCLLRRTVAECERTGRGGEPYRRVDTNEVVRVSPLRRWEGAAKRLSMRLPVRAQHVGRRVWFALTRRSG